MKRVKKLFTAVCVIGLLFCLSACGSAGTESAAGSQSEEQKTESSQITEEEPVTESARESSEEPEAEAGASTEENDKEAAPESVVTAEEPDTEDEAETTDTGTGSSETLVVFFSATGTTKGVAETIAEVTGADGSVLFSGIIQNVE